MEGDVLTPTAGGGRPLTGGDVPPGKGTSPPAVLYPRLKLFRRLLHNHIIDPETYYIDYSNEENDSSSDSFSSEDIVDHNNSNKSKFFSVQLEISIIWDFIMFGTRISGSSRLYCIACGCIFSCYAKLSLYIFRLCTHVQSAAVLVR